MHEAQNAGGVNRRDFLKDLAAVGLGGGWLSACTAAGTGGTSASAAVVPVANRSNAIGLQLYTVRDRLQRDFEGTVAEVAQVGFKELEFAGYYNHTPAQVRAILDRLNLRAPSTHISLDQFRKDLNGVLSTAQTVGHEYVVIPSLPESERSLDAYRRLAAEFNRYGQAARQRGMRFGYHNHSFEFEDLGGGQTGFAVLLKETDPALVDFELDLFWTVNSGRDPVELFAQYPGRFPLWHVKDMADIQGAKRMVAVGQGEIDFRRIFANAERSGMKYFFVEHDRPEDSLASIRTSYQHLRQLRS